MKIYRYASIMVGFSIAFLATGCAAAQPSLPPSHAPESVVLAVTASSDPAQHPLASPTFMPTQTEALPTSTSLPPLAGSGGGILAFGSDRSGRPGIYVMNADGSDQRLVTDIQNAKFPDFSPDGSRIAYVTSTNYDGRVKITDIDGFDQTTVLSQNRAMADPDWSPDGDQLVFIFHTHQYFSVSVVDSSGRNFRHLTQPATDQINQASSWSPDGQVILFTSDRDGDQEIYSMNSNGKDLRQLTNNEARDYFPAWSPDGSQIAFSSDRDGNWEIYVMDVSGGHIQQITVDPAEDWWPAWSPDGQRIAFASKRDGNWEIYTMNADGSQLTRLTDNAAQDTTPDWRPN